MIARVQSLGAVAHPAHRIGRPPRYAYVRGHRRTMSGLWYPTVSLAGLGDSTSTITSIASVGLATTTKILVSLGVVTGPVGAAIAGIIAVGSVIANMFHGCGPTCVQAAADANKIEPPLQQNVQAYIASPTRTKSMQAAALNNFLTVWNVLTTACSDPSLGAAGQRCISDRQQGSCAYKTSPGGWNPDGTYTWPGANGSGSACWNWWIGYHDPIANDPFVVDDPNPLTSLFSGGSTSSAAGASSPLSSVGVLAAIMLALAFLL